VQLEEVDDPLPAVGKGFVEARGHRVHLRARDRHVVGQPGADNSTSASAEASSGSMKPADSPIATTLRCQKRSR
jgi:hypothetical protein